MDNWGLNYEKLKQVNPGLNNGKPVRVWAQAAPGAIFAALGPTEHAFVRFNAIDLLHQMEDLAGIGLPMRTIYPDFTPLWLCCRHCS